MTRFEFIADRIRGDLASRHAIAAHVLATKGYTVQIPATRVAPSGSEAAAYVDDGDLFALVPLGVKQCGFNFTSAVDYPHPAVLVCSVEQHDRPAVPPRMYYRCSADLQHVIEIPVASFEEWSTRTIENTSYPGGPVSEICYFAPLGVCNFRRLEWPQNPFGGVA